MKGEIALLSVEFHAASGGQAPLTWGQRSIWRPLQALSKSSSSFNLKRVVPLSEGVGIDVAASALRQLIERHQSLRAHFIGGERPQQRVEASGSYQVELLDVAGCDVADAAASAVLRLAGTPFDLETEWPARIAFIVVAGNVQSIAVAISHVGTDFFGLGLLVAELRTLLSGGVLPSEPSWQPLSQAELEASPNGLRRSQRSLQYWRKQLAAAPERIFSAEPGRGEAVPFQTWALTSPAVAWAAQILAERTRTSSSTVLLAASALLLRAVSRRERAVLKLIASNRFSPHEQALVAPTCADGIFVCAPEGGDVASAIVRSHRDATLAYMNAAYDPDALSELTAHVARERGAPLDVSAYFNDARIEKEWPRVPVSRMSRVELERLRSQRKLELIGSLPEHDMSFCVTAFSDVDALGGVTLLADTRRLSAAACQRSLLGFEALLCEAALRPVGVDEIPALLEAAS